MAKRKNIHQPNLPIVGNDVPTYHGQDLATLVGSSHSSDLLDKLGKLGIGDPQLDQPTGGGSSGSVSTNPRHYSTTQGVNGKTAWQDLLNQFGNSGDSDVLRLLNELGIGGFAKMNPDEGADWNKQLLNTMLQQMLEEDARKYNEGRTADQRLYDSPTNMLARLMGAGISRDAAIQMLSGSGGSGSGSVFPGDAASASEGLSPSETRKNSVDANVAIANTVFGGLSSVVGLAGLGFTIPQAIQQTKAFAIQNSVNQRALQGLQATDAVLGAFGNAVAVGMMTDDEFHNFKDGTEALNYAYKNRTSAAFAPIFADGSFQRVFGSKNGREQFQNAWKAIAGTKSDGSILEEYLNGLHLDNELKEIQWDKIDEEINVLEKQEGMLDEETKKVQQDIRESRARIKYLNKQGKWVDVQTTGKSMENEVYAGYKDMLSRYNQRRFQLEVEKLDALFTAHDGQDKSAAIQAFLSDSRNAAMAAYIKNADLNASVGFQRSCPTLYKCASILQRLGVLDRVTAMPGDYIEHVQEGATMAAGAMAL